MTNSRPDATEAAAWSDGELIGSLLNLAVDLFVARGNQQTTTVIETRMADQYAELHGRLARAESGVTISVEDLRRWITTALAESGVSSAMCWTVEPIISCIIDAALADAGDGTGAE